MSKFVIGLVIGVLLLVGIVFGLGIFEEASDGPLENAAESVEETMQDTVEEAEDSVEEAGDAVEEATD